MDSTKDFLEKKYKDTFEVIYNSTMQQIKDGKQSIESVEALLRDQYIYSDQDWLGRGEIKDTIIQATIAALEVILLKLKMN